MRQTVQERVGGHVVPVTWRSEQRGRRGEEHEEIQWYTQRQCMEIPGSTNLGRHHRLKALQVEVEQNAVVQACGGVNDAFQGGHGSADLSKRAGYLPFLSDISPGDEDLGTCLLQACQYLQCSGRGLAPAHQDEMPCPALDHPLGNSQA